MNEYHRWVIPSATLPPTTVASKLQFYEQASSLGTSFSDIRYVLVSVFHANLKFFSIEKNLLIYSLNNNNNFTKKQVSYFIFPKITPSNSK